MNLQTLAGSNDPEGIESSKQLGWSKAVELVKVARRDQQNFESATWLHKARSLPKEEFKAEVERELVLNRRNKIGRESMAKAFGRFGSVSMSSFATRLRDRPKGSQPELLRSVVPWANLPSRGSTLLSSPPPAESVCPKTTSYTEARYRVPAEQTRRCW